MMDSKKVKGRICVTGGTGFLGSWTVKRLLEDGYSVNTTTRINPGVVPKARYRCLFSSSQHYLTNLPGASERLKIFNADLDKPESFTDAIAGCHGVFHTAHPLDFEEKESEETKTKRVIDGTLGILQACIDSTTVKRVVYTSSLTTVLISGSDVIDEDCWTDVDLVRSLGMYMGPYAVTKTLAEKAAFEFAEKHGLDLVSVLPTWITGPFICPNIPDTVHVSVAVILGDEKHSAYLKSISMVHVDDVVRAHIHLFENPNAKGRYICTGIDTSIEEIYEFISANYPEYQLPNADSWKGLTSIKTSGIPSKKLLETGFVFENGLAEILDGAIKCCKERGYI